MCQHQPNPYLLYKNKCMCYWRYQPIPTINKKYVDIEFFFKIILYCYNNAQIMDEVESKMENTFRGPFKRISLAEWFGYVYDTVVDSSINREAYRDYISKHFTAASAYFLTTKSDVRFVRDIIWNVENAKSP